MGLTAEIEVPEGAGEVEEVCWDFEATDMPEKGGIVIKAEDGSSTRAVMGHVFEKPGTYFPVAKVASNRTVGDPFTRVMNQDRVRIVVTE